MDGIAGLLAERGKTHGDFGDHARITQGLKEVLFTEHHLRCERGQRPLSVEQLESLDMICHKIGRIIAGDAGYHDHWDDIAGYAKLCSKPPATLDDETMTTTFGPVENYTGAGPLDNGTLTREKIIKAQRILHTAEERRGSAAARQVGAFGEGDETPACHHHRLTAHCHICNPLEWSRDELAKAVRGAARRHGWIADTNAQEMAVDKHPCLCDRDRCQVENGHLIGNNVFCCQAEAGG